MLFPLNDPDDLRTIGGGVGSLIRDSIRRNSGDVSLMEKLFARGAEQERFPRKLSDLSRTRKNRE